MAAPLAIPVALTVLGGITKAIGQYKANEAEAKARRANAQLMIEEADYLLESSKKDVSIYQEEVGKVQSSNMASFAKQGFTLSGSPLDVIAQQAFKASEQVMEMRKDAVRKAKLMKMKAEAEITNAKNISGLSKYNLLSTAIETGAGVVDITQKK